MKINLFSFIIIFIFVHSAAYHMISTEAGEGLDAVLDKHGNELRSYNYYYYVLPVSQVSPYPLLGGLTGILPCSVPDGACTYGVYGVRYAEGNPVAFHQPDSIRAPIFENTDLNITFGTSIGCNSTGVWRKGERDEANGQSFVMIGVAGNTTESYQTRGNAFQIRKAGDGYYKFVYCPPTCDSCYEECEDVGIFDENGASHLAVSGNTTTPFHVQFQLYGSELARY